MDMRTRSGFITAGVVTAVVAGMPAVAEAHHVAGGGTQCDLVGNVPTITAWAKFESFATNNKPVAGQLTVDGTVVETISGFTFPGATGTWNSAPHAVTSGGTHHVIGVFTWPNQGAQNGRFEADVSCPAPVAPPQQSSPPTPPTTSTPPAPLPASVAPPAATAPQPSQGGVLGESESGQCVPAKLGRYRITATPKNAVHGLVTFQLHGRGVSHVRWYVDKRRAGVSGAKWEWLRQHGRTYSVYLWAQPRFGEHLWGRHTIEARFHVKDSCGATRAVRAQQLFFNHDPLPEDPLFVHDN